MDIKIKSCTEGKCYSWYKYLVGKSVKAKPIGGINKDYVIDDNSIKSSGTAFDSYISGDDVEVL